MLPLKKLIVHIHHIATHFTNALFPVASVLITLYLITDNPSFETACFYSIIFGLMSIPAAYGSGIYDWKTRFQGRRTFIFNNKIIFGILFLILACVVVLWRFADAGIMYSPGLNKWLYVSLVYSLSGIAAWLGYLGGKFI